MNLRSTWTCGLPPSRRRLQSWTLPSAVGRVDVRAGREDLVDAVEQCLVEGDVRRGELAVQMLHRARPDDRRRDGRVVEHERDGELDERDPCLVGELRE